MESLKPLANYYNFMTYLLEGVKDPRSSTQTGKAADLP